MDVLSKARPTLVLTVVAGDVEIALVELAESAELHVGLISPVHLRCEFSPIQSHPIQHSQRERRGCARRPSNQANHKNTSWDLAPRRAHLSRALFPCPRKPTKTQKPIWTFQPTSARAFYVRIRRHTKKTKKTATRNNSHRKRGNGQKPSTAYHNM